MRRGHFRPHERTREPERDRSADGGRRHRRRSRRHSSRGRPAAAPEQRPEHRARRKTDGAQAKPAALVMPWEGDPFWQVSFETSSFHSAQLPHLCSSRISPIALDGCFSALFLFLDCSEALLLRPGNAHPNTRASDDSIYTC